ncbi:uncharacterized protein BDR25DRAFT_362862 [Lindgomyces ingoldianus]|uniref:Uncharacterized protein n=1 Tax=Lindgomyces ingoldianus TaxID=673940 RepID=A0ACB6QAY1_9PLEO|nr:uncharacterized protein BDR25DRAFT_362862 [Lindgomyces ingoldianus]KAF2463310.1 hypothetical protein BDR25DRAFT_362862 [Lindgomyces ingoldianus]
MWRREKEWILKVNTLENYCKSDQNALSAITYISVIIQQPHLRSPTTKSEAHAFSTLFLVPRPHDTGLTFRFLWISPNSHPKSNPDLLLAPEPSFFCLATGIPFGFGNSSRVFESDGIAIANKKSHTDHLAWDAGCGMQEKKKEPSHTMRRCDPLIRDYWNLGAYDGFASGRVHISVELIRRIYLVLEEGWASVVIFLSRACHCVPSNGQAIEQSQGNVGIISSSYSKQELQTSRSWIISRRHTETPPGFPLKAPLPIARWGYDALLHSIFSLLFETSESLLFRLLKPSPNQEIHVRPSVDICKDPMWDPKIGWEKYVTNATGTSTDSQSRKGKQKYIQKHRFRDLVDGA